MERLITISRKQHDSYNNIATGIAEANKTLQTMASTILQGVDEDLGQVNVSGAVCRDGVYSLVIQIPDIAPPADAMSA